MSSAERDCLGGILSSCIFTEGQKMNTQLRRLEARLKEERACLVVVAAMWVTLFSLAVGLQLWVGRGL